MQTLNLTYWPIRGVNQAIVSLLEYTGLPYTFHKVASHDEWFKQKAELATKGLDFPNLPFIEHNGKYHSESFAIMAYVAGASDHHELLPQADRLVRFLELYGVISDLDACFTGPAYRCKSDEELKTTILTGLKQHGPKLQSLAKILSANKWILGEQITILDFRLAEVFERMKEMSKDLGLNNYDLDFTHFDRYLGDFLALPAIAVYRKTDRFFARPFNNFMAHWK